jgi:hypothetical protein
MDSCASIHLVLKAAPLLHVDTWRPPAPPRALSALRVPQSTKGAVALAAGCLRPSTTQLLVS